MHDLILAKQISDMVKHLADQHQLVTVAKVSIEVGDVGGLHQHADGEEHNHDIEVSNLKFHLNNFHPETRFSVKRNRKFEGWKLKEIEGE
ncbi:MAG: hypothetical protein U9P90_00910 [Patescibacteria group bacterium]|nr:hypothetical protein [Patescibacteria group bacterium]